MIRGYANTGDLETALRKFVGEGIGREIPVIPGNDFQPAPETPYATLLLLTDDAHGTPNVWRTYDANSDSLKISEQQLRSAMYRVQWFRTGDMLDRVSMRKAYQFAAWCRSELGVQQANRLGIRLASCSDVRRMDAEEAGEWEERYVIELGVDYIGIYEYDVGYLGIPADEPDAPAYLGRRITVVHDS